MQLARNQEFSPKVSVLMSVYNDQLTLSLTIDSILKQTYDDFEFIIIDDCSTDKISMIINQYAALDHRIVHLRNVVNLGLTKSLNIGLRIASAPLVARIDSDDVSHPERLRIQQELMVSNDIDVIGTNCVVIDQLDALSTYEFNKTLYTLKPISNQFVRNPLIHSSVMFRKKSVLNAGGYNEDYPNAQDNELWLRMSDVGFKFGRIDSIMVGRFRHDKMISESQRLRQTYLANKARFKYCDLSFLFVRVFFTDLAHMLYFILVPSSLRKQFRRLM